jgi:carbonic anhydrase
MDSYKKLLLANKAWVIDKLNIRPDYFESMAEQQTPEYLWIGCSDSRVPAESITCTGPGEIFVHRNIANQVMHNDLNFLSVLQYAVEVLNVKHVIVCGHYNCGGIRNALSDKKLGLIDTWLAPIKEVYNKNIKELEAISSEERRLERFVELNVLEQVNHLSASSIIQGQWQRSLAPTIHGWVYDIKTGYLKNLCVIANNSFLMEVSGGGPLATK